jgi:hypothetical protein
MPRVRDMETSERIHHGWHGFYGEDEDLTTIITKDTKEVEEERLLDNSRKGFGHKRHKNRVRKHPLNKINIDSTLSGSCFVANRLLL